MNAKYRPHNVLPEKTRKEIEASAKENDFEVYVLISILYCIAGRI